METEVIATTKTHKHGPQRLKSSLSGPVPKKLFEILSSSSFENKIQDHIIKQALFIPIVKAGRLIICFWVSLTYKIVWYFFFFFF